MCLFLIILFIIAAIGVILVLRTKEPAVVATKEPGYFKRFLRWVKPSFEGADNKASIRRLVAMVVLVLYSFSRIWFTIHTLSAEYLFYALALDATFFCMLMGIILVQHILEFWRGYKEIKK